MLLQLHDENNRAQLIQAESELLIEQKGVARDKEQLHFVRANLELQLYGYG